MVQLFVVNDKEDVFEDCKYVWVNGKLYNGELDFDMKKFIKIVNKLFKCSQCGKVFVFIIELVGYVRIYIG